MRRLSLPVSETDLSACEHGIQYTFKNPDLLQLALTHRSFSADHNERLEFLGDSVLGLCITDEIYSRLPNSPEGDLSRIRAHLVCGETLAEVADELNLGPTLRLGTGEHKAGGRRKRSIRANTVEAIIGAVYLDGGLEAARSLVLRVFESRLNQQDGAQPTKDAKTRLQELLQKDRLPLPKYELLESWGKMHEREFRVSCSVSGEDAAEEAEGGSRRDAEQRAAEQMLNRLGAKNEP